jgi:hypothetical protein
MPAGRSPDGTDTGDWCRALGLRLHRVLAHRLGTGAGRDQRPLFGLANAKRALPRARAKAAEQRARGERDAAAGRRRGRLARAVNDLIELLDATRQIAEDRSMTRTFTVLPAPRDARTDVDARLDALSDAPVITVFQTLAPGTRRLNGSTARAPQPGPLRPKVRIGGHC